MFTTADAHAVPPSSPLDPPVPRSPPTPRPPVPDSPPAPLSARVPVATAWTGTELLVWGSTSRDAPGVRDGAAFYPRANRWRPIAPAPVALNLAGWPSPSTVWTGRELVVVGALLDDNNAATRRHVIGLAYDPAADRWRRLPDVRLSPQASAAVWTD